MSLARVLAPLLLPSAFINASMETATSFLHTAKELSLLVATMPALAALVGLLYSGVTKQQSGMRWIVVTPVNILSLFAAEPSTRLLASIGCIAFVVYLWKRNRSGIAGRRGDGRSI